MPDTTPHYGHDDAMRDLDYIDGAKHSPFRAQTDRLAAYIASLEAASTRCEPSEDWAHDEEHKDYVAAKRGFLASQQPPTITDAEVREALDRMRERAKSHFGLTNMTMSGQTAYLASVDSDEAALTAALADRERLRETMARRLFRVTDDGRVELVECEKCHDPAYVRIPREVLEAGPMGRWLLREYESPTHDTQEDHHE